MAINLYSVREIIPDIRFTGSNGNAALNVVLKPETFQMIHRQQKLPHQSLTQQKK